MDSIEIWKNLNLTTFEKSTLLTIKAVKLTRKLKLSPNFGYKHQKKSLKHQKRQKPSEKLSEGNCKENPYPQNQNIVSLVYCQKVAKKVPLSIFCIF